MEGNEITQESFEKCESREWTERTDPYEEYDLTEKVEWKNLNGEKEIIFKGRAIDLINLILYLILLMETMNLLRFLK